MIAPKMPSRTLDICDISTRIVPVQKAFSLITRRSTKTDGPRIQAKSNSDRRDSHSCSMAELPWQGGVPGSGRSNRPCNQDHSCDRVAALTPYRMTIRRNLVVAAVIALRPWQCQMLAPTGGYAAPAHAVSVSRLRRSRREGTSTTSACPRTPPDSRCFRDGKPRDRDRSRTPTETSGSR
jgi:hypothetical protein